MTAIKKTKAELFAENEKLKKQIAKLTSKKRPYQDNEDQQRTYHQVIENSPISIIITDSEGIIEYTNPFFSELTGLTTEEAIGKNPNILSSGHHSKGFYKELWDTIKGGNIWHGEFLNKKKNGDLYWEAATICPVLNNKGKIIHFVATKADITCKKEAEEKFRQLAEQLPNMIFINKKGRIVYVNKKCEEVMGYTRDEFYSSEFDFRSLIEPEYLDLIKRDFEQYLSGEEAEAKEYAIHTKAGKRIDVLHSTKIIAYDGSSALLGIITDITGQKKTEQALEESELRFRKIFEEGLVGIAIAGPDYRFIRANSLFCKMFGYLENELQLLTFKDLTHPEYIESSLEDAIGLFKGRPGRKREKIYLKKNKEQLWGEVATTAIRDEKGNFLYYLAMVEDISEKKKAQLALLDSEEKHRHIVEHSTNLFYSHTPEHVLTYISPRSTHFLGCDPEEAMIHWIEFATDNIVNKKGFEATQRAIDTGEVQPPYELEIKTKDGRMVWVEVDEAPVVVNGKTVSIVGALADITERKKAVEALQEAYDIINKSPAIPFLWKNEEGWPVEYVSENVVDLFEYTAEEFMSEKVSYSKLIYPEDLERVGNEVTGYSSEEGTDRFSHEPYRIVTKSGKIKWVEDKTYIRRDEKNNITHYQGIVEDITARRQTELARLESEERFSKTFNSSPNPMIISEIESGKVVDVNNSFEKLIRYSKEEIIGKSVLDLNLWANSEDREYYIKKIKEEKRISNLEIKIRTKSGDIRDSLISGEILTIQGKHYLLTSGIDITERKLAENALKEQLYLNQQILETTLDGYILADSDGKIIDVNPAYCDMIGYTWEELLDMNIREVEVKIPPEEVDRRIKQMIRRGGDHFETKHKHKDGHILELDTSTSITYLDEAPRVAAFMRDITERKQVEDALKKQSFRNRQILQSMLDGYILADTEGKLVDVNPSYCKMSGYSKEELLNMNIRQLETESSSEEIEQRISKMVEQGYDRFGTKHKTKNGSLIDLDISIVIMHLGTKPLVSAFIRDITASKIAEIQLKKSYNQLRNLAERLQLIREEERAAVSREIHDDLGQVLTALKMDISSLQRISNVEQSELNIRTGKMLELVNSSIQTVKRIASELRPGILDDLGLFSAIEWQAEEFQERTKIECNLNIQGKVDAIDDEISIAVFRIFQETLTNITRHSNATHIEIKISCSDKELMMEVEDNGRGISSEELNSSRSLGIIGMKERANILRGEFEVSGDPGKGTKVTVKIPLTRITLV